jgi:2-polyprenyl-3-methyl-5-hydroxy-6-metoxy-1,4-benzoquinol methylase
MQMATGYWASATLLAANELGVFGLLGSGALSARAVAAQMAADERAVTMLLDACAGLGLLVKQTDSASGGAVYVNSPAAAAFLVPGKPGYLGGALKWSSDQFELWGRLPESVRTGAPAADPALHLGDDPAQTRSFVMGMHSRALGTARRVVPFLAMEGATTLLDVGGGPGTYATLLAQRYPNLTVEVLDLPAVAAIATELIAQSGMSDRVRVRPGDAVEDDYGAEVYDAVLFSGVLHQMSGPTIANMLRKAYAALRPGGRVWISDMMLNGDKTQPAFSTLFSLQMLLTSNSGAVFSSDECLEWLALAGFVEAASTALPPPLPYVVQCGRKPV